MSDENVNTQNGRADLPTANRGPSIDAISGVMVCGACGDAVGSAERFDHQLGTLEQLGTCPLHEGPAGPTWPGYDYNRFVQLCQGCGTAAIQSGSRYSRWFCPECREQVELLNARLDRYAIPIGRHSALAGRLLSARELDNPVAVQMFVDFTNDSFAAMTLLEEWAKHVTRRNLEAIGHSEDSVIPIAEYCRAAQRYVLPEDRFREMCLYLHRRGREVQLGGPADPAPAPGIGEAP